MKLFSKKRKTDPAAEPKPGNGEKKQVRFKISFRTLFRRRKEEIPEEIETEPAETADGASEPEAPAPEKKDKKEKKKKEKKKKDKPKKPPKAKKKKKTGDDSEGKKKKPVLLIIIIAAVVVAGGLVAFLFLGRGEPTVEERLAKAEQYTQDEKYDKAEAIYQELRLEDLYLADAYLGSAGNYLAQELTDQAVEVLEQGYEITGDERIEMLLNKLRPEEEAGEGPPAPSTEPIVWQDAALEKMVRSALSLTGGEPVSEADLAEVTTLKIVGGTHAAVNGPVNAYNSLEGYRIDDVLYTELGEIRSLADLSHFKNLRKLTICYNEITDIGGISELTGLETLGLYFNRITDLSALSGLVNIKYLYLYNNEIRDIGPIANLSALRSLYVQHNQITDLTPLRSLTNMRELYLNGNNVSDLSPLSGLSQLSFLYAENNEIADLSPLQGLPLLSDVSFSGNPVTDYTPVNHVRNINRKF